MALYFLLWHHTPSKLPDNLLHIVLPCLLPSPQRRLMQLTQRNEVFVRCYGRESRCDLTEDLVISL